MKSPNSLPGRIYSDEEANKRLENRIKRHEKPNNDPDDSLACLQTAYILLVFAMAVSLGIYYLRHVSERTQRRNSMAFDRTVLKMIEYIHSSVNDACNESNTVTVPELEEHFGRSPTYEDALRHITNTVYRNILYVNHTFKSLAPNWPARCRLPSWRSFNLSLKNPGLEMDKNTAIVGAILLGAVTLSFVIARCWLRSGRVEVLTKRN